MATPNARGAVKGDVEMDEEKREILRMLSEGTIDVEAAERLMTALDSGRSKCGTGAGWRQGPGRPAGYSMIAETMNTIRETVAGIGPAVRSALETGDECGFDDCDDSRNRGEEIPVSGGGFGIEPGTLVRVVHTGRKAPGSLTVTCSEGASATIGHDPAVRVYRQGDETTVVWSGGDLLLGLPSCTGRLKARSRGGDMSVSSLAFPVSLRTMGGNLTLTGMKAPFKARTMGGSIRLSVVGRATGSSMAKTMGGNIEIELDTDARESLGLLLETMGGTISGDAACRSFGSPGRARFESGLDREHRLTATTMGGNIHAAGGDDA